MVAQGVAGIARLHEPAGEPAFDLLVGPAQRLLQAADAVRELVGIDGAAKADGQAVQGEHVGEGQRVRHHEHAQPIPFAVRLRRHLVDGVRHREQAQAQRALRVEVLAHLADAPAHVARNLLQQPLALLRMVGGVELLQHAHARPLAVDGQEAASRKAERVLDDLAAEGDVDLQEVRGELGQGAGQDVLSRRAAGGGSRHHRLQPPQAVRGLLHLARASLLQGLHLRQRAMRESQLAAQPLRDVGELEQRGLAAARDFETQVVLSPAQAREVRLHPREALRKRAQRLHGRGVRATPRDHRHRHERCRRHEREGGQLHRHHRTISVARRVAVRGPGPTSRRG